MRQWLSLLMVILFLIPGATDGFSAERSGVSLSEAIALALVDAGARVVVNVPATGVTVVYDSFCDQTKTVPVYSFHEEVAYTLAHGAAVGGARSAAILKSHGLAKAANSVIDSITAGTNAGMVALVLNDRTGKHSDNVFDSPAFLNGLKLRFTAPRPENTYSEILAAFETSEKFRIPVAVSVESDDLDRVVEIQRRVADVPVTAYHRDVYQHLLCPLLAPYQQRLLETRLNGSPAAGEKPVLPSVPDQLPSKFRGTFLTYVPVFDVFKRIKGDDAVIAGDTGTSSLFAFSPYDCVDITTYYGGSIPLAMGFYLAGRRNVWAVTGDYAFVAAGHLGLVEAVHRGIPLKVIIFHNGVASATGGQPLPPDVFAHVIGGYGAYVRHIEDPTDREEIEKVLTTAKASSRLEIVVVEVP